MTYIKRYSQFWKPFAAAVAVVIAGCAGGPGPATPNISLSGMSGGAATLPIYPTNPSGLSPALDQFTRAGINTEYTEFAVPDFQRAVSVAYNEGFDGIRIPVHPDDVTAEYIANYLVPYVQSITAKPGAAAIITLITQGSYAPNANVPTGSQADDFVNNVAIPVMRALNGLPNVHYNVGYELNMFASSDANSNPTAAANQFIQNYANLIIAVGKAKAQNNLGGQIDGFNATFFTDGTRVYMDAPQFTQAVLAAGAAQYITAITVDPYNDSLNGIPSAQKRPEELYPGITQIANIAQQYGKPWGVTEMGKSVVPNSPYGVTPEVQAEDILRSMFLCGQAGAQFFGVWALRDEQGGNSGGQWPMNLNPAGDNSEAWFGVNDQNLNPRPAADDLAAFTTANQGYQNFQIQQANPDLHPDGNPNHWRIYLVGTSGTAAAQWTSDDTETNNSNFPNGLPIFGQVVNGVFTPYPNYQPIRQQGSSRVASRLWSPMPHQG